MKNKKIINFLLISLMIVSSIGVCHATTADNELPNPLGTTSISVLIGRIINGALGIVGSLALLMFIYGGIIWMTSGGNEEKVKKGKQTLIWAVLGIVIIFTSYSILNLVFEILGS
jgi:amino acid transporter